FKYMLSTDNRRPGFVLICACLLLCVSLSVAHGQSTTTTSSSSSAAETPDAPPLTMWKHSDSSRFWISGQENIIFQGHPSFDARYSATNSLKPIKEERTSFLSTLFLGLQATSTTEILIDIESAAGHGISDALGLAGFTDLDVVRNPQLGAAPYLARAMVHQIVPLTDDRMPSTRGPLSLATQLPVRRLEFRAGKFGTVDMFDLNTIGSDSHLQFLNWTIDNNGAYDYAADTRGYTVAAMAEYQDRAWGLRFAEALMPKVANGPRLDSNPRRARSENIELEFRPEFLPERHTVLRLLNYVNHANMGSYHEAVQAFLAGIDPAPTIELHRRQGRIKYG